MNAFRLIPDAEWQTIFSEKYVVEKYKYKSVYNFCVWIFLCIETVPAIIRRLFLKKLLHWCIFIYVCNVCLGKRKREREISIFHLLAQFQMATKAGAEPGWSQDPGTLSQSPMWVQEPKLLGNLCFFPKQRAGWEVKEVSLKAVP